MNVFICKLCGNEIDTISCPYCDTLNLTEYYSKPEKKIISVSVKNNLPTVNEAVSIADSNIATAKINGVKIIKFIHGYGSKGKGGDIRIAIRNYLRMIQYGYSIYGEDFSTKNIKTQNILRSLPELKKDSDLNKKNKGITLFIL